MAYKKLGPDVSETPSAVAAGAGQYTADEHSFESVVFQQDRPVLDWELNLVQEILGQAGSRLLALKTAPSCFLTGDFLERPDLGGSYSFLSAIAGNENKFVIKVADLVVNGWPIRFEYSGSTTPGENVVQLAAPPGGGNRTDLVILEVWRALVASAPSTLNKSPTGQILRNGNAKAADQFPPGNVNLADDILDPSYLQESAKRVQIQYRYRVISGAALGASDIDGFGTILARSVPYQAGSDVDGEAPVSPLAYASQSSDSFGLWRAGNGNAASATALGSVDGYMYAVPLCAVFRRNSSAFNEASNANGAPLIGAASNPRPDDLYSDQIVADDVRDLRHGVSWDPVEVLDKNFQYLLDNTLSSNHELFTDGASTVGGTAFTVGDNVASSSQSAGQADGVRTHFSDRAVTESCVHQAVLAAATSTVVSLSAIASPWGTTLNVSANGPVGTVISGVSKVRNVTGSADIDLLNPASSPKVKSIAITSTSVTVTFTAAVTGTVSIELLVTYPSNVGLQRNVLSAYDLWSPPPASMAAWVNAALFSVGSNPASRYSLTQSSTGQPVSGRYWWVDGAHRELTYNVPANSQTTTFFADTAGKVRIPERVSAASSNTAPYVATSFVYDGAYTVVTFSPVPAANTAVSMTYTPFRPPPFLVTGTDKYTVWYKSRALQSLDPPAGTQTLQLVPRHISKVLHVITSGSGSPDGSFPFESPSAQIPIPTQPASTHPESRLDSPSALSVFGFGSNTGYLQIPALIPYSPNPSQVTLYRDAVDGVTDGDSRKFWPRSDDGSAALYAPTSYGPALGTPARHKVALPVLCELKSDYPNIGVRGTMVMVVFVKWMEFGTENGVTFSSLPSDTGAAVYRLKGGFLSPRRTDS